MIETIATDIESSGTDPKKHAILEVGMYLMPRTYTTVHIRQDEMVASVGAFKVNGLDIASLADEERVPLVEADKILSKFLFEHLNLPNAKGKHLMLGFNVPSFDLPFIKEHFKKCSKWFHPYSGVDLNSAIQLVNFNEEGINPIKNRLKEAAHNLILQIEGAAFAEAGAHTALYDAAVHYYIWKMLKGWAETHPVGIDNYVDRVAEMDWGQMP